MGFGLLAHLDHERGRGPCHFVNHVSIDEARLRGHKILDCCVPAEHTGQELSCRICRGAGWSWRPCLGPALDGFLPAWARLHAQAALGALQVRGRSHPKVADVTSLAGAIVVSERLLLSCAMHAVSTTAPLFLQVLWSTASSNKHSVTVKSYLYTNVHAKSARCCRVGMRSEGKASQGQGSGMGGGRQGRAAEMGDRYGRGRGTWAESASALQP